MDGGPGDQWLTQEPASSGEAAAWQWIAQNVAAAIADAVAGRPDIRANPAHAYRQLFDGGCDFVLRLQSDPHSRAARTSKQYLLDDATFRQPSLASGDR